jgi:hypothetical protein
MGGTKVDAFVKASGGGDSGGAEINIAKARSGDCGKSAVDDNVTGIGPGKRPGSKPPFECAAPGMSETIKGLDRPGPAEFRIMVEGKIFSVPDLKKSLFMVSRYREKPPRLRPLVKTLEKLPHLGTTVDHIPCRNQPVDLGRKADFLEEIFKEGSCP